MSLQTPSTVADVPFEGSEVFDKSNVAKSLDLEAVTEECIENEKSVAIKRGRGASTPKRQSKKQAANIEINNEDIVQDSESETQEEDREQVSSSEITDVVEPCVSEPITPSTESAEVKSLEGLTILSERNSPNREEEMQSSNNQKDEPIVAEPLTPLDWASTVPSGVELGGAEWIEGKDPFAIVAEGIDQAQISSPIDETNEAENEISDTEVDNLDRKSVV